MKKLFLLALLGASLTANCQLLRHYAPSPTSINPNGDIYLASLCQSNKPLACTVDNSILYEGQPTWHFINNATDSVCGGSKRSELYTADSVLLIPARWFDFTTYVDASYVNSIWEEGHFQLQTRGSYGPNFELVLINGLWYANIKYTTSGGVDTEIRELVSSPANVIDKGNFERWTIHFIPGEGVDGLIEVYKAGVLVYTHSGQNINIGRSYFPKWGLYNWPWNTDPARLPGTREKNMGFVDVYGGATTITDIIPPPAPVDTAERFILTNISL